MRTTGDDFLRRGWCVCEMHASTTVGWNPNNLNGKVEFPLLLHVEKMDDEIPDSALSCDHWKMSPFQKVSMVPVCSLLMWALDKYELVAAGTENEKSFKDIVEVLTDGFMMSFQGLCFGVNGLVMAGEGQPAAQRIISVLKDSLDKLISGEVDSVDLKQVLSNGISSLGWCALMEVIIHVLPPIFWRAQGRSI